jgi:hypothetical protein
MTFDGFEISVVAVFSFIAGLFIGSIFKKENTQ